MMRSVHDVYVSVHTGAIINPLPIHHLYVCAMRDAMGGVLIKPLLATGGVRGEQ